MVKLLASHSPSTIPLINQILESDYLVDDHVADHDIESLCWQVLDEHLTMLKRWEASTYQPLLGSNKKSRRK